MINSLVLLLSAALVPGLAHLHFILLGVEKHIVSA